MDQILDAMAKAPKSNKTEEEIVNDVLNHPFFMNSINENNREESLSAIQSLVFDGTPEGLFFLL